MWIRVAGHRLFTGLFYGPVACRGQLLAGQLLAGQLLTGQLLTEAAKTAVKTRSEDWEGLLNC